MSNETASSDSDDPGPDFGDLNERLADFGAETAPDGAETAADPAAGTDTDAMSGPMSGPDAEPELDQETIDAMEEAQAAMADARARLADVPAEVVVTNHVMGLYELAAIHLSATPPDLEQSVLAIDAVACLVDGLGDRLGPEAPTMRDALNNIRLAFVQIKGAASPAES